MFYTHRRKKMNHVNGWKICRIYPLEEKAREMEMEDSDEDMIIHETAEHYQVK